MTNGSKMRLIYTIGRNIPIYLIVIALVMIAIPKEFYTSKTQTESANNQNQTTALQQNKSKTSDQNEIANIARLTMESSKEKYDSIKDLYEKIFSVIAALGALFAFLGFKGADSFIQARQKAEETLKTAEAAQDKINKFLSEIYPKNNKAEVNITTGIVLRHIADAYEKILRKTTPDHALATDPDYCNFIESGLYYLDAAEKSTGLDEAMRTRIALTKGNMYKRLGDYKQAIYTLEQQIKNNECSDDGIYYNLACYYTLQAQVSASSNKSAEATKEEDKALGYLEKALVMNRDNIDLAKNEEDFSYFRNNRHQGFDATLTSHKIPCHLKGDPTCPIR